jgi:D-alanyl-D-alanine carboxypeptidase/D-alanyl-D-alanine-endopeptidase (penicillin-binding protein 4)
VDHSSLQAWLTMRKLRLAVVLFSLTFVPASIARGAGPDDLRTELDRALAPVADRAFVGVCASSLTRGDVLWSVNADRPFVPASNAKIATSAAALAFLGPEYRFKTSVLAQPGSWQKDGVLRGDLALRGGGDPVLMPEDLARLASRVHAAGIRAVQGRLIADDTRFDSERLGSGWTADDEPAYYSAQISALTVNRNVVSVQVRPGPAPGAHPQVEVGPLQTYLEVDNQAQTGARGSPAKLEVTRARASNRLVIRGSIPIGAPERPAESITVEDPTLFTALVFRKLLAAAGVNIAGRTVRGPTPAQAAPVAEFVSRPLREVVAELNKPSDNLIAEMLLKTLGAEREGQGTAAAGLRQVRSLLKTAGVDLERVQPHDGSGLSRRNLTTPHAIVQLLAYVRGQPYFESFYASLPVAGVDGTLRRRMVASTAGGRVHAKTGTIMHVSALSGYVTAANGEEIAFSVMTNNFPGSTGRSGPVKEMEDRIAILLSEFAR